MSSPPIRVLFVCLGNICRSPSAQGLLRARAQEAGLGHAIQTDSAGSIAFQVGKSPDARAQRVGRSHGVELGDLRARLVVPEDFQRFDYLLAMDRENLATLLDQCPKEARGRVSLFMSFAPGRSPSEVPDPYSGAVSFEHVWALLEQAVEGFLEHLCQEHGLARRT